MRNTSFLIMTIHHNLNDGTYTTVFGTKPDIFFDKNTLMSLGIMKYEKYFISHHDYSS
jgi:hypothetical protein